MNSLNCRGRCCKTKKVLDVDTPSTSSDRANSTTLPIQALSCCHVHPQLQCTYPKWCYRTFGMVLNMFKMNVVFKKDHKLSILQIAGEDIIHSHYQGIQRHCNFFHGLCCIIKETRLNNFCFVYCNSTYSIF